jgi:cardiolipin synthase (CMP-forming)
LRRLPTLITLVRLLASPVLACLLFQSRFREALLLVLIAGVTDWLDGFAARKLKASGGVGVVLDPLADKVLLVTLFTVLTIVHLIPLWMLALVLGRDLVIVTGALLLRVFRGYQRFLPSVLGKVSTFFQIVLAFLVLAHAAFPLSFIADLEWLAIALTALFTAVSGADYVRLGIRMTKGQAAVVQSG